MLTLLRPDPGVGSVRHLGLVVGAKGNLQRVGGHFSIFLGISELGLSCVYVWRTTIDSLCAFATYLAFLFEVLVLANRQSPSGGNLPAKEWEMPPGPPPFAQKDVPV